MTAYFPVVDTVVHAGCADRHGVYRLKSDPPWGGNTVYIGLYTGGGI